MESEQHSPKTATQCPDCKAGCSPHIYCIKHRRQQTASPMSLSSDETLSPLSPVPSFSPMSSGDRAVWDNLLMSGRKPTRVTTVVVAAKARTGRLGPTRSVSVKRRLFD